MKGIRVFASLFSSFVGRSRSQSTSTAVLVSYVLLFSMMAWYWWAVPLRFGFELLEETFQDWSSHRLLHHIGVGLIWVVLGVTSIGAVAATIVVAVFSFRLNERFGPALQLRLRSAYSDTQLFATFMLSFVASGVCFRAANESAWQHAMAVNIQGWSAQGIYDLFADACVACMGIASAALFSVALTACVIRSQATPVVIEKSRQRDEDFGHSNIASEVQS